MPRIFDWLIWTIVGVLIYAAYFSMWYFIAVALGNHISSLAAILFIIAAINSQITYLIRNQKK